eukprot:scaffold1390_cov249-Pinguiococcus_pyrenoidosus.AAC.9
MQLNPTEEQLSRSEVNGEKRRAALCEARGTARSGDSNPHAHFRRCGLSESTCEGWIYRRNYDSEFTSV